MTNTSEPSTRNWRQGTAWGRYVESRLKPAPHNYNRDEHQQTADSGRANGVDHERKAAAMSQGPAKEGPPEAPGLILS